MTAAPACGAPLPAVSVRAKTAVIPATSRAPTSSKSLRLSILRSSAFMPDPLPGLSGALSMAQWVKYRFLKDEQPGHCDGDAIRNLDRTVAA